MQSKPEPWVVFDRRNSSKRCIVSAETLVAAKELGTKRLGLTRAPQHVEVVAPFEGETVGEAIRRATR